MFKITNSISDLSKMWILHPHRRLHHILVNSCRWGFHLWVNSQRMNSRSMLWGLTYIKWNQSIRTLWTNLRPMCMDFLWMSVHSTLCWKLSETCKSTTNASTTFWTNIWESNTCKRKINRIRNPNIVRCFKDRAQVRLLTMRVRWGLIRPWPCRPLASTGSQAQTR